MLERSFNFVPQPLPLALTLRSWVAPQHCPLSYADTKVRKKSILYYNYLVNFHESGEKEQRKGAQGHRAP